MKDGKSVSPISRREALGSIAALGSAALAGCSGNTDSLEPITIHAKPPNEDGVKLRIQFTEELTSIEANAQVATAVSSASKVVAALDTESGYSRLYWSLPGEFATEKRFPSEISQSSPARVTVWATIDGETYIEDQEVGR